MKVSYSHTMDRLRASWQDGNIHRGRGRDRRKTILAHRSMKKGAESLDNKVILRKTWISIPPITSGRPPVGQGGNPHRLGGPYL